MVSLGERALAPVLGRPPMFSFASVLAAAAIVAHRNVDPAPVAFSPILAGAPLLATASLLASGVIRGS